MTQIIPTEADREAAREWNRDHGGCCDVALAKAFASRALVARIEALEEAAKVVELSEGAFQDDLLIALTDKYGGYTWQEVADICDHVAAALRAKAALNPTGAK